MRDIKDEICERADDLIAFLYGELGEGDAHKFERHLHECARCETEFASFGRIRESIVSWRDESLGAAWLPGTVKNPSLAPTGIRPRAYERPSALAAIREFLNLSPMWLKGAAAFASLLFCICAVLAIGYLKYRPTNIVQAPPSKKIYTQGDLDALVAQEKKKFIESQPQPQKQSDGENVATAQVRTKAGNRTAPFSRATVALNPRNLRKPLTRQERQELAADLGLSLSHDEDGLDLVGDKINQTPE